MTNRTQRGFAYTDTIVGPYQDRVFIKESSGNNPCIWLDVTTHEDLNAAVAGQETPETRVTALITTEQALMLAEQLVSMVRDHFLLDANTGTCYRCGLPTTGEKMCDDCVGTIRKGKA